MESWNKSLLCNIECEENHSSFPSSHTCLSALHLKSHPSINSPNLPSLLSTKHPHHHKNSHKTILMYCMA